MLLQGLYCRLLCEVSRIPLRPHIDSKIFVLKCTLLKCQEVANSLDRKDLQELLSKTPPKVLLLMK